CLLLFLNLLIAFIYYSQLFVYLRRTDNAIKNHWNCSVKKRQDLYFRSFSALELLETTSPNSGNHEEMPGSKSYSRVAQSLGKHGHFVQRKGAGNPNFCKDTSVTSPTFQGHCTSSEGFRNLAPLNCVEFDLLTNVKSDKSGKPCNGSVNSARQSWDSLSTNSLNSIMDSCHQTEKCHASLEVDRANKSERMFGPPKRPRCSPCVTVARSEESPLDTILSLSLRGLGEVNLRAGKRNKACERSQLAGHM
ncbi:uncharacterized protein, partial [Primulina huaijiensis]|uniref:uncharacterized protein n=1 Tax=Primulina huaijiensis TaxID=1492673 RepID=UPI003CC749C5